MSYGYYPGQTIAHADIGPRDFEWGKECSLVSMPCEVCGKEHMPVVVRDTPNVTNDRYVVVAAGECPKQNADALIADTFKSVLV